MPVAEPRIRGERRIVSGHFGCGVTLEKLASSLTLGDGWLHATCQCIELHRIVGTKQSKNACN